MAGGTAVVVASRKVVAGTIARLPGGVTGASRYRVVGTIVSLSK